MFKEGIYGKKYARTREITRKTTVLRVLNTVMAAYDGVLAATNGKNANIR